MGDWNTPLEIIDTYNYQLIRHKHFNEHLKRMISSKDLLDIWENRILILKDLLGDKKTHIKGLDWITA